MKELQQILEAFERLCHRDGAAVLVSVLRVEGSAYRRAGARALIAFDRETVGLVSGGCLEADLALRASAVFSDGAPRCVRYDSRADEDRLFGLGVGCHGAVDVLLERVDAASPGPLGFLRRCYADRRAGVLVVQVGSPDESGRSSVARWTLGEDDPLCGPRLPADEQRAVDARAREVRRAGRSHFAANAAGATLYEWLPRQVRLLLLGAGPDATPLVALANELGWRVELVDPRAGFAKPERFPSAHAVMHGEPRKTLARLEVDSRTAVVVMNHHYERDRASLAALWDLPVGYLGVLGPRARTAELLDDIQKQDVHTTSEPHTRLHAPVGLDVGAESPHEVALSIVAEIQAVLAGHSGGFLRERQAPIHAPNS